MNSGSNALQFDYCVRQSIRYGIAMLSLGITCLVCAIMCDFLSYTFDYTIAFQYIAAVAIVIISTQMLITFAGRNRLRFFLNEPRRFQVVLLAQITLPAMALVLTAWNFRSIPGSFIGLLIANILFLTSATAAIIVVGASNVILQKALHCAPDSTSNTSYQMSRIEQSTQAATTTVSPTTRFEHARIRNHQFRRVSPPSYNDVNNGHQCERASAPPDYTSIALVR
ncbi:uncharacterized protein TRIADDRAFT_58215 [Trichoplax adhaerens]|uniref:Uncharacterized protein n=1 Tax=Trichoplax adhaerens TaxID=10228 RepID=B3S167_TRIAD|nr:predicted protein [Trichoplax adhaerens]EDV23512.1 predicted protein [Trichoplax adhaerens]|eukprot:XP_002114422.1 predicted protein [Trichoplax adhaerens]